MYTGCVEVNSIQVYSVTTDNASNMVKCGRLMYEEIEEALDHELEEDRDEQDFLWETKFDANVASAAKQFDMNIFNINRCGAHTLALAIEDALKRDEDSKKTLARERRVVKKLRTPNLMLKLRERGAPKPIIDVTTRWGSTYDMLERLLVLKSIIHDFGTFNEDIALIEEEWVAIEQLKKDMEAPRNATTRIQDRLITAGALLAEWELMEFLCQGNEGSYFSLCLKEALHARKNSVVKIVPFSERYTWTSGTIDYYLLSRENVRKNTFSQHGKGLFLSKNWINLKPKTATPQQRMCTPTLLLDLI